MKYISKLISVSILIGNPPFVKIQSIFFANVPKFFTSLMIADKIYLDSTVFQISSLKYM